MANVKTFTGSNYFRQRLVLATLSRTSIKIKQIRTRDDEPGLRGMLSYVLKVALYPYGLTLAGSVVIYPLCYVF